MLNGRNAIFITCSEKYRETVAHRFRERIEAAGLVGVILSEMPKLFGSWTPEEKLDEYLRRCEAHVVLCTPDDKHADDTWSVRGNVLDEIGRARTMGHLRDCMAVFKTDDVALPSNIDPVYERLDLENVDDAVTRAMRQLTAWNLPRASTPQDQAASGDRHAEVELRGLGNGASEHWVRWFQVDAQTTNSAIAYDAQVTVSQRGVSKVPEQWLWQGAAPLVDLRSTGARIPLVIGGMADSAQPLAVGWWVSKNSWYLTPEGHRKIGRFIAPFIPNARHVFDVVVTWIESKAERKTSAAFELRFWKQPESEPRFIRIGDRPTFKDQLGGLSEQHARGVALRNEGETIKATALADWNSRIQTWTDETLTIINEAAPDQAVFFRTLNTFVPRAFDGVIPQGENHLPELRVIHERLNRLQKFIRSGEI